MRNKMNWRGIVSLAAVACLGPGLASADVLSSVNLPGAWGKDFDIVTFHVDAGQAAAITFKNYSPSRDNGNKSHLFYYIDDATVHHFQADAETAVTTVPLSAVGDHVVILRCDNEKAVAQTCSIDVFGATATHLKQHP